MTADNLFTLPLSYQGQKVMRKMVGWDCTLKGLHRFLYPMQLQRKGFVQITIQLEKRFLFPAIKVGLDIFQVFRIANSLFHSLS